MKKIKDFKKKVSRNYLENKRDYSQILEGYRDSNLDKVQKYSRGEEFDFGLGDSQSFDEISEGQGEEVKSVNNVYNINDYSSSGAVVGASDVSAGGYNPMLEKLAMQNAKLLQNSLPSNININYNSTKKVKQVSKTESLSKIPDNLIQSVSTDWEPVRYDEVDEKYKLYMLSSSEIVYDNKENKIFYRIIEPDLSESEERKLGILKEAFIYVFEKNNAVDIVNTGTEVIKKGMKELCEKYSIILNQVEFERVYYYLVRDFLGLEMLEPLLHDPYIEDISCDGLNVPIFVNHLKYGSIETNRVYRNSDKLDSFIVKLAQKSNQEVSVVKPILQGTLPDGSRVEAIYGKEVSKKGSSFTIRKFREEPYTPIHLIELGTCPSFLLAYLWVAIENKMSILVSGGTATGKTTILNALSLFITPTSKIVSIEDTPEINLPHEHWLSLVTKESGGDNNRGDVSMFDLLKASLRERPEFIIVGEIRGKEASILFQGMATGHAGMGTVHAEVFDDLINRMTIDPINLPVNLITEVDIILFQRQAKVKGRHVRRTRAVEEVLEYDPDKNAINHNTFLNFLESKDLFSFNDYSGIMTKLLRTRGGDESSLWKEIEKRKRILERMQKLRILEFKDVANVIRYYYQNPKGIFNYIDSYVNQNDKEY